MIHNAGVRVIRRKKSQTGVRSHRRASARIPRRPTVSGDPEIGKRVEVSFLTTDKIYRMKWHKVEQFSASGLKISFIPLKKPE